MTIPVFYILLRYVLTLIQMVLRMFKLKEICDFFEGDDMVVLSPDANFQVNNSKKVREEVNKHD